MICKCEKFTNSLYRYQSISLRSFNIADSFTKWMHKTAQLKMAAYIMVTITYLLQNLQYGTNHNPITLTLHCAANLNTLPISILSHAKWGPSATNIGNTCVRRSVKLVACGIEEMDNFLHLLWHFKMADDRPEWLQMKWHKIIRIVYYTGHKCYRSKKVIVYFHDFFI